MKFTKTILTILSFLILPITSLVAQSNKDSITMQKSFWGYKFYQGEQKLKMKELAELMRTNESAHVLAKRAHSNFTLATVIGTAGGFMIGWPLGASLAGGEPNWAVAGIGAGLVIGTIPINDSFIKKSRKAIDIYNREISSRSFWERSEMSLTISGSGMGFSLRF